MAFSNYKITPPVSIHDVQGALATGATSLADLCTANGINVWAKYKPTRYGAIDTTRDPDNPSIAWLDANKLWIVSSSVNVKWWRNPQGVYGATLYCCGFKIPGLSGVNENIATQLGVWEYQPPRGGAYNEPYRLIDFNQYYANAVCPFRVELPAQAVLANGILNGKCFIRTTAGLDALNLTKDDLFAQFGEDHEAYYGIAAVKGTSVYAKTVDDNSPLVSLNGLNTLMGLTGGEIITLVAFVTRTKSTDWTPGQYQVYSLNAPGIDFAVVGECKIVTARETVYQMILSGFIGTDKSALRAGEAVLSNSRIVAERRGSNNFNYNYTFDKVTVHTDKIDSDGNVTSMSAYDQTYTTIYVNPDYIDKREGWTSQIVCEALFTENNLPTLPDPTVEFYQITYTIHYVRD